MKFLLDTNALLFWLAGSTRMKPRVRARLADPESTVYVSAVSTFEIALKASIGRLEFPGDPQTLLVPFFERSRLSQLPITLQHTFGVYALPHYHSDPFDRLLVSQATAEGLTLGTSDRALAKYAIDVCLL